jgi:hypothetical protein
MQELPFMQVSFFSQCRDVMLQLLCIEDQQKIPPKALDVKPSSSFLFIYCCSNEPTSQPTCSTKKQNAKALHSYAINLELFEQ